MANFERTLTVFAFYVEEASASGESGWREQQCKLRADSKERFGFALNSRSGCSSRPKHTRTRSGFQLVAHPATA
jgi:hypothetical protein